MKDTRSENPQFNTGKAHKTGGRARVGVEWGLNFRDTVSREVDPGQQTRGNDHKPTVQSGSGSRGSGGTGTFRWK